jgi:hypothetical protein
MKNGQNGTKPQMRQEHKLPHENEPAPTQTAVNGALPHQDASALDQVAAHGNQNGNGQSESKPTPSAFNGNKPKNIRASRAARVLTERLRNGLR